MTEAAGRVSFHDPDGSVYLSGQKVLRALAPAAAERIDAFLATDVFRVLAGRGQLPATSRLAPGDIPGDEVWFEHQRLPFINYPHEWVPEQFVEACTLTLEMAIELRASGWDLKDGNARNVVFDGLRPVFVDFGSFQQRDDSTPVWRPAGQIQRHFLLPLLVRRRLGLNPDSLLLGRPDGLSHEEAHGLLRGAHLTDRHVFWLCTLPVWLSRRSRGASAGAARALSAQVCQAAADRTARSLLGRCRAIAAALPRPDSDWARYESARTHYTAEQLELKRRAVDRMLGRLKPADVLDVGTNGGEFANLAAGHGSRVVSIDTDVEALRVARQAAKLAGRDVLHLHVDFTAPTPALGWSGAECQSFDQRCHGRFDFVLALAVMHHVLVSGRIPLDEVLAKLARYTRSWLLVEYVDPSDVMFAALARERASDFSGLDAVAFERALARHFSVEEHVEVIPGRRALYLCRRH